MVDTIIFLNPVYTIECDPDNQDSTVLGYIDQWCDVFTLIPNKTLEQFSPFFLSLYVLQLLQ